MNWYQQNEKGILRTIWISAVVVPVAVAVILNPGFPRLQVSFPTHFLSLVNACINATVAVLLVLGFIFIKNKKIELHRKAMLSAFILSAVFLLSYVVYHVTNGHTIYREDCGGVPKWLYLLILYSHIGLSGIIIPLASLSIFRALSEKYDRHRKIAKITFPIWLYIAVTGVLIYLLISPCYT